MNRFPFYLAAALLAAPTPDAIARGNDSGKSADPQVVKGILRKHCYECHGADKKIRGDFRVMDPQREHAKPNDSSSSRIMVRILDLKDPMPPRESNDKPLPRLSADEIAAIRGWIDSGAESWNSVPNGRPFINHQEVFSIVLKDLDDAPEVSAKFYRYFTLTEMSNGGAAESYIQNARFALVKLLNSLTWEANIVRPKAIDARQLIYRVDLRDLGWTPETWGRIAASDPFALVLNVPSAHATVRRTGCLLPIVRADSFIFFAAQPTLYYDILQSPPDLLELQRKLSVDARRNIEDHRVIRGVPTKSGVAPNNRMLERQPGKGISWFSYDMANSRTIKNFRIAPEGPAFILAPPPHYTAHSALASTLAKPSGATYEAKDAADARYQGAKILFVPDGTEVIYSLPNSFQAFFIANGAGKRVDAAPVEIVSDPDARDRTVRAGVSCFRCHSQGFLPVVDSLRAHIERNRGAFERAEVNNVLATHPPADVMAKQIERDNAHYLKALTDAGIPVTKTDPISLISDGFEAELNLAKAAAEADVTPSDLLDAIERNSVLRRGLGDLRNPGGRIARDSFLELFSILAAEVKQGVVTFRKGVGSTYVFKVGRAYGSQNYHREVRHHGPQQAHSPIYHGDVTEITVPALGRVYAHRVTSGTSIRYYVPHHGLVAWQGVVDGAPEFGVLHGFDQR